MSGNDSNERLISHYRIIKEIGHGGFGRVYQAQNTELEDHIVAIKRLYANEPLARERFRQEARVLLKLKHPSILPFIDFFSDEDGPCLVTDFAGYGSLRNRISQSTGLLPMEEVRLILSQVGQALQYIHERKIIHCDLKPENILFNTPGKALLADFGIAKIVADVSMERGEIIGRGTGTPVYMAPEQINGRPTPKSDQYAFACIGYEMLTGLTPFKGSRYLVLQKHLTEPPADPRVLNHDIPEHMALALLKALAKNPDDRHADMNAFLAALGVPLAQETTRLSPKDLEALLNKATELSQRGSIEDALALYNRAIEHDSKSIKAYYGRANTLITQPKPEVDALAAALTDYNQALRLDRDFIPAYIGKGDVLCLLRRYRAALKVYQTAVNIAPDSALYLKMAQTYSELKEGEKALVAYEAAIRYGADAIETRQRKITLLLSLHRDPEAIREFNHIIRLSPHPLTACYEKRDFILNRIRYYDEALAINELLATYEQILKLKQSAPEVYYEEIAVLEGLGEGSKRLAIYDRIIERVPSAIKVQVYYKKAALLVQLNRARETPAIYDDIINLTPDNITAQYEKLAVFERLEWPEDTLKDALETCDCIIEREPGNLDVYHKKRYLLERLKRYDQVIDICKRILDLDPNSHETHHQKGKAHETLEKTSGRTRNNLLRVRLTPVSSGYLDALGEYEQASRRVTDNSDYRTSKEKLLLRLGKANQARLSQSPKSRYPVVSWFFWVLPFLVLPTLINTGIGALLLALWQHPELWMEVALGAFCISIFGAIVLSLNDKPYHLYQASLLFYPISCFLMGWLIMVFLILRPEMSVSLLFPLVLIFIIIFTVNAAMYFFIDVYEEQTFVIAGQAILMVGVGLLAGAVWLCGVIGQSYNAWQEQQKIAAQKAKAAKKAAPRQRSFPKASPASPRNVKNSSSRAGKSVKKPSLSPSSKGVLLKQANKPKQPITRKKPSNRHIYRK